MKKLLILSAFFIALGCNSGSSGVETEDSGGLTNPTAIDTTKHPSGLDNSSAISTDTAAMNVQNAIKAAKDSAK